MDSGGAEFAEFFTQQQASLEQNGLSAVPPAAGQGQDATDNADFNKWMTEQFGPDFQTQDAQQQSNHPEGDGPVDQAAANDQDQAQVTGGYSPSSIPFELQPRAYSPSAPIIPFEMESPPDGNAALPLTDQQGEPDRVPLQDFNQFPEAVNEQGGPADAMDQQPSGSDAPTVPSVSGAPTQIINANEPIKSNDALPGLPQASTVPEAAVHVPKPSPSTFVPTHQLSPLEAARAQTQRNKHDHTAWKAYLNLSEQTADLDKVKDAYEEALHDFPNTAALQIAYINHYLTPPLFKHAEALFARFLRPSPSVELWKFYLTYVRRINTNITDTTVRDNVRKAYEFALSHVGQDMEAGQIWRDYIDFLKNSLDSRTTWDAQQKMDALRSAYHRAVVIPLDNVEALWRELDAYENGLNKITAKKFLADLSPGHMTAKTALRELKRLLAPIATPTTSTAISPLQIDLPPNPTWTTEYDRSISTAWKAYIKWEEGNPLELDDLPTLQSRIITAYRKAVARMRFYPDINYLAFHSLHGLGKQDEAVAILKQGVQSNPSSFVLSFAYAEIHELQKNLPEVHSIFDALVASLHTGLEALEARIENEVTTARQSVLRGEELDDASAPAVVEAEDRARKIRERRAKDVEAARNELGLVWIMLMRFSRRSEGLKPARTVFAKARKDRWVPWAVYEAAALMEYHCTKAADVATKIFEIGLKQYADNVDYVVRYLGFLISINDENNARALFERTITTFPEEKGRSLWERWARYEYNFADLGASQKLEQRIAEALPNNPPIKQFAYKYTYLNIDAIATRDLGFGIRPASSPVAARKELTPAPPVAPTPPPTAPSATNKRAGSPLRRRDPSPPPKRFRGGSPPRNRDREWERGGDRGRPRNASPRRKEAESLPDGVVWFLGSLPSASAFDGPKFRTEDLMHLLKTADIPRAGGLEPPNRRSRSPPPPPRGGRPPPDYGPYQGPGGGRRRH